MDQFIRTVLRESWYRDPGAPVQKLIQLLSQKQYSFDGAQRIVEGIMSNPSWPLYLLEDPDGSQEGTIPHAFRVVVGRLYFFVVDNEDAWDMPEMVRMAWRIFPEANRGDIVAYPYHAAEMLQHTMWKGKSLRDVVEIGQALVKASGAVTPSPLIELATMYGFA